ncbi:MAG: hypothetical protein PUK79_05460, partial [Clostridiales bacterium]|nr:hypothetical protein [Clostridiales bacterium]
PKPATRLPFGGEYKKFFFFFFFWVRRAFYKKAPPLALSTQNRSGGLIYEASSAANLCVVFRKFRITGAPEKTLSLSFSRQSA